MRVLRAIPLVLGWLLPAVVVPAQDEAPPIFSKAAVGQAPAAPKRALPEIARPALPLSPRMRTVLTERVGMAIDQAAAAAPPGKFSSLGTASDPVMMERYVVKAKREKNVEVENVPSLLLHSFMTGEIVPQKGSRPSLNWGLSEVHATGYGSGRSTPRFELSINWRF